MVNLFKLEDEEYTRSKLGYVCGTGLGPPKQVNYLPGQSRFYLPELVSRLVSVFVDAHPGTDSN